MRIVNAGYDCGYSNCKLVFGAGDENVLRCVFPSGVADKSELQKIVYQNNADCEFKPMEITVNGRQFVAAVSHNVAGVRRILNDRYTETDEYYALFLTALRKMYDSGVRIVDNLVTGLPTNLSTDEAVCDQVRELMTGTHDVGGDEPIKVNNVMVVSQPLGGFSDYVWEKQLDSFAGDGTFLLVDCGYFSFDWLLVKAGAVVFKGSDTNKDASSRVLEETSNLLQSRINLPAEVERIEKAIRSGSREVYIGGDIHNFSEELAAASYKVFTSAFRDMQNKVRDHAKLIDKVILCGGGAHFPGMREAALDEYDERLVDSVTNPVLSNALGFYLMAC